MQIKGFGVLGYMVWGFGCFGVWVFPGWTSDALLCMSETRLRAELC